MRTGLYLGLSLKLVSGCPVCQQDTLPITTTAGPIDPSSPECYKKCSWCHEAVPYAVRRTKGYQRRWDADNAEGLYSELLVIVNSEYPAAPIADLRKRLGLGET